MRSDFLTNNTLLEGTRQTLAWIVITEMTYIIVKGPNLYFQSL